MTRFYWTHTPANVFIGDQVQVRLQFGVQVLFEMLLAEHIRQSQQQNSQSVHFFSSERSRLKILARRYFLSFVVIPAREA